MIFEIDPVWESEEFLSFEPTITVPADVIDPDCTYRVRVRHKNQLGQWSHWSGPIEFRATADVSAYDDLVLSELMYHPADVTEEEAAHGFEESDFEYIELWNRGATAIDLEPLRFTKGVDLDLNTLQLTVLAAGERLILARKAEAFAFRYGADLAVAGSWGDDQLSNGGERVKLSLGGGAPVIDFSYKDSDPWPIAADGDGRALEFAGEGEPSEAAQWRVSVPGGSPGKAGEMIFADTLAWVSVSFDDEGIVLEWQSSPGKRYQVERSMAMANWERVGEMIEGRAGTTSASLIIPADQRLEGGYLRVVENP